MVGRPEPMHIRALADRTIFTVKRSFGIWFVGVVIAALATGGLAAVMARGQDPEG